MTKGNDTLPIGLIAFGKNGHFTDHSRARFSHQVAQTAQRTAGAYHIIDQNCVFPLDQVTIFAVDVKRLGTPVVMLTTSVSTQLTMYGFCTLRTTT